MSRTRYRESVIPIIELHSDLTYSLDLLPIRNESLEIVENGLVLKKLRRRSFIQVMIQKIPLLWQLYLIYYRIIAPICQQLKRKDEEKSLLHRILGLNIKKIKSLLKL